MIPEPHVETVLNQLLGGRLVRAMRVFMIFALMSFGCGLVSFNALSLQAIYETYFNPEPLLDYPASRLPVDRGLPADKMVYLAGDSVLLTIARYARVDGDAQTTVYLSQSIEPGGAFLVTKNAPLTQGYSVNTSAVAAIPPNTPAGVYCLAGVVTYRTRYGTKAVPWHSTWFYVAEGKGER